MSPYWEGGAPRLQGAEASVLRTLSDLYISSSGFLSASFSIYFVVQ